MSLAYYNEIDPYAAQWLRNLIDAGHIAPGVVDERSIEDVHPSELDGFTQCHFFAGIGVWSYALRLAGWPDDRPVWSGSCPCQPFSAAGKGLGFADERHLWPAWHHLIRECRPAVVFGEQVASADGLAWFDLVHADLEAAGYAVGAADLCAAGVGAPHIRQRLWFVGDADHRGSWWHTRAVSRAQASAEGEVRGVVNGTEPAGTARHMGDAERDGLRSCRRFATDEPDESGNGQVRRVAVADDGRLETAHLSVRPARQEQAAAVERRASAWSAADWIPCADGKARPIEPGLEPMVDGAAARVGRLRAYGNAIVAQAAAEWIGTYLDVRCAA